MRAHTIEEILASPRWAELEELWRRASAAPASCLGYCGVHRDYEGRYPEESAAERPYRPDDAVKVRIEYV